MSLEYINYLSNMPFAIQIVLPIFLIVFVGLAHKDIRNGIYAIIFLMPAYLIRLSFFGIPTTMLEIMIYALFLYWLYINRISVRIFFEHIKKLYDNDRLFFWGISLIFFGVFLSAAHSSNLRTSLGIFKGWFIDPFLFFVIFIDAIKDSRQVVNSMLSLILSGFVLSLIGIIYALCDILTFDGRLRAFFESPNYLAMYLAPGFLFAAYLFILNKDILKNTINKSEKVFQKFILCPATQAMILICLSAVLFLTESYGAFLGLVVALFLFMLREYDRKKMASDRKIKKAIAACCVVIMIPLFFFSYQKYGQIINSNERSSFHSRLMIWNASFEILKDNPVFGIGPGTFQEVYLDYQSRFSVPYLEWAVAEPHNTFLAFYLQAGLAGLTGFVLLIIWLFRKAGRNNVVFLFLTYFLVHSLVDTLYWKNDLSLIFWMMAGIVIVSRLNDNVMSEGYCL